MNAPSDPRPQPAPAPVPPAAPASPAPPVPSGDDTGTRALDEALRSSFLIVKVLMLVLVAAFLGSGVFTVAPQDKALILRCGKPVGSGDDMLLGPGLHWAFPYPIDEVVRLPIGQIHTVKSSVGWYALPPAFEGRPENELPPPAPSLNPTIDGYTLTADGNIIHVRATLRYQITDPLRYAFRYANASNLVQHALDNALVFASARYAVDNALREDLTGFKDLILRHVEQWLDTHQLGISLEPADIVVSPPRAVKAAFDDVLAAQQDLSKTINAARGYENALLSRAVGESNAVVNAGLGDRDRLVQAVAAESQYFTDRLPEYTRHPDLFRQRLVTESAQRVLTNAQDKFLVSERLDGGPRELRLLLNREPEKSSAPRPNTAR